MVKNRQVRVGIDVGGTHTKAVAIDNETKQLLGKSSVKTTHHHEQGVAAGVVASFLKCLNEHGIAPDEVIFVAHSTTQATNALLEGDVAKVGVIAAAGGSVEAFLAKRQTSFSSIELETGRHIAICSRFIHKKNLTEATIHQAITELLAEGCQVFVATSAFGVDAAGAETFIYTNVKQRGLECTAASEITKLYGLSRRTRTAVINGSILPKMLETAQSTETSVRQAGVTVPLMIMRGDGGVMDINEMKKRPVLTMLSGPAASVMGSLIYLRASNGIYFEVGGTSTNIGVIKDGRPVIDYSQLNGRSTYISSLDVRVLGVAGGSMVRVHQHTLVDVGPRSAHIGGMDYAVFTPEEEIVSPVLEFFSPKEGDPADYVAIRLENGKRITLTNTCAANVLGLIKPEHFSYGNVSAARKAMQPLAEYLGMSVEDVAEAILAKSFEKIEPVISGLAHKYRLEKDQISLVGVGGGASSLIGYCAQKMQLNYSIPENAEVISSIGVALSMVQDVVERIIPNPTKAEIQQIRFEALNKAIESGATKETVNVHISIDAQTQKVTATATGSTEVQACDLTSTCSLEEAREIAQQDFRNEAEPITLLAETSHFYLFGQTGAAGNGIRVIDSKGFVKVQRGHAKLQHTSLQNYQEVFRNLWEDMANYKSDLIVRPDFYVCSGARLMDFASQDFTQLIMLVDLELASIQTDEELVIIAANQQY